VTGARDRQRTDASTAHEETETMTAKTNPTATAAQPRSRWRLAQVTLALALALGVWLAIASPASADFKHVEEGSFGPFEGTAWLAIDNSSGPSSGDVYVGYTSLGSGESAAFQLDESGAPTGVELNAAETPAGSFGFVNFETFQIADGLAVDDSSGPNAGQVYLSDAQNEVIDRFNEAGEYECQITGKASPSVSECAGVAGSHTPSGEISPGGIAVNPANGDLYVSDGANAKIYKFNQAGEYIGQIADSHITEPGSLAFDSAGNLYLVNGHVFLGGTNGVKLDSSGNFVSVVTTGAPITVGVDRVSDHVYFGRGESGVTEEYNSAGTKIGTFGGESISVDVNDSNGKVYETVPVGFESEGKIWSADIGIPTATVSVATAIAETTATLHGEAKLAGGPEIESCEFEYGTSTAYDNSVACSQATPYASDTAVSATPSGLVASTTYHYRLVLGNENGAAKSGDETFITKGPPTVESESVDHVTRTGAEFHASINPHGYSTSYVFQYVTQAQYEVDGFTSAQSTSSTVIGAQETPQAVSKAVSGLTVGTKYHYRVVATSSHGAVPGVDKNFTTVLIANLEGQYDIAGIRKATLEVDVNPLGLDTSCHAQWVSDAEFQKTAYTNATTMPCEPEDLGAGSARATGKVQLENLEVGTKYHFRFVVENSSGTVVGEDQTFETFGITKFEFRLIDEAKEPETQAGAHPWELVSTYDAPLGTYREGSTNISGLLKDVLNELPPGLIGNPNAVPKCRLRVIEEEKCTGDAQVGKVYVQWGPAAGAISPLYNAITPKGVAATFAGPINVGVDAYINAGIRSGGDYGINAGGTQLPNIVNLWSVEVTMWGVPADPSHDAERRCGEVLTGCASNAEPKPFLRMPTSCSGKPLNVNLGVDTYQEPGNFFYASRELPAVTGCNQVEFEPSIEARPTTKVADSPTGLHVDLHNPQNEDPEGLGVADVKDVALTFPKGITVNPAGANGLEGCSPAQVDLHGPGPAHCPDGSKIGTAEVDTPLVDHPLHGGIFIATPHDNPFNSLLATYIAIEDPRTGVIVKLAGEVKAGPEAGQLSTTFQDNPQLPFSDFKVDLFSGALAPLRTPPTCGSFSTTSDLTPWSAPDSGPDPTPSDSYQISSGPNGAACASSEATQPNNPAFDAGTQAPIAAKYSPFVVNLRREDGSQQFKEVTVSPPLGLVAKLAGTTYCPEAALAAAASKSGNAEKASPSCPASSRIGTVNVGAGAGPAPFYVGGTAYLAGPYKGAPLSLAIITPAVAGPFDLGTVVVRAALQIDPETVQITAKADPIPHILEGIPLDIRSVAVKMDKPEFTRNPTSCDAMAVDGRLISTLGQSAALSDRFQIGDCSSLGFEPKLETRLFGKTNRGAHPSFRATLTMPAGDTNIARASVKLPRSEILDQGHIRTICTRVQFAVDACPAGAVYGYAVAQSPLLDQPLQGPVYLRSSSHKLPDLVADLRGQIHVAVVGRIDSVGGGIRNTFEAVPDAPVSKFTLTMKGGAKGLLQNSTNICKGTHEAIALFDAHNGAVHDSRPPLKDGKCAKAKRSHRRHGRGGGAGAQG
jgi:hypothetical protein